MYKFYVTLIFLVFFSCFLYAGEIANHQNQEQETKKRTVGECLVSDSVSPEEMGAIATLFDLPGYLVVQQSGFQLVRDDQKAAIIIGRTQVSTNSIKHFGQQLYFGEIVQHGLIWNSGSDEIVFVLLETGDEYIIQANEMISIGNYFQNEKDDFGILLGQERAGCSVSCRGGYYACCNIGPPPNCVCYKDGTGHICTSGGEESTSCSIIVQP